MNKGSRGNWLRKGLVVGQFIASVGLIASTLVIYNQLRYMQNKRLGVNIDQMLIVRGPNLTDTTFWNKSEIFRQNSLQLGAIKGVSASTSIPGQAFGVTAGGIRRFGAPQEDGTSFHAMAADQGYASLYEMELVAGRHMSFEKGLDTAACLLNERGVAQLNFATPEDAIGVDIDFWGDQLKVVGVLKDFHQESPKAPVEPLILRTFPQFWTPGFYSMKVQTENLPQTLASLERSWKSSFPSDPFEYFFLDDHFNRQYESDQRFGQIFTLFSGLAIFVSCLGLLALVAFITERKKKEIGIRKVLGASLSSIVILLSKDFLWLVLIALAVATPFAWYLMQGWLEGFANRIQIQWWYFALAGIVALGIAFATISIHSVKAALANPVKALRNE